MGVRDAVVYGYGSGRDDMSKRPDNQRVPDEDVPERKLAAKILKLCECYKRTPGLGLSRVQEEVEAFLGGEPENNSG